MMTEVSGIGKAAKYDVRSGASGMLGAFLRNPKSTGAIAASSRGLADAMLSAVPFEQKPCIVELGPGTGSFTREILRRMQPGSRMIALETDIALYERLVAEFGAAYFVNRSAAELQQILLELGIPCAQAVVSGLPWASFGAEMQESILTQAAECLSDDGVFLTFAYVNAMVLPGAQSFRRRLARKFRSVTRSRVVWGNVPPAFVYICRK